MTSNQIVTPRRGLDSRNRTQRAFLMELECNWWIFHPMHEVTLRYHPQGLVSVHQEIWDGDILLHSTESASDRRFSVNQTLMPLIREDRVELLPGHYVDTCQVSWWSLSA